MSVKIYIVEDEPLIADTIALALTKEKYHVVGIADNAKEALFDIEEYKPDLILIDINIKGDINGIELAQRINKKWNIPFIYLTSQSDSDTINQVKKTHPAGFIVKPFNESGLKSNIEIALFKHQQSAFETPIDNSAVFIKNEGELIKIDKKDILFIEAFDNYAKLFTHDKEYLLSFTLKNVLTKLNHPGFVRIHRSYVINVYKITSLCEGYAFIGSKKLPVGRTYKDKLMKFISLL